MNNHNQSLSAVTQSMTKQAVSSPLTPPRMPEQNPTTPMINFTLENIKTEQGKDIDIQLIIADIHAQKKKDNFILYNKILFRLAAKRKHGTKNKVPYVPSSMIHAVLKAFHDHPMSGHFGVKRTLYKIRTRFWWPNMRKSIEHYISSCQQCRKFNILRSKTPGHLKSFDPPTDVFQILHMDFWGSVRPSAQGNRYVLVLTDNLSKYVIAKAMPNNTAKAAAEFIMNEFIMIHGAPERPITDNGVHFNNTLLKTIATTMHITHVFSASYHPQTNGHSVHNWQ
ncbi:unnamed protein product, partial [Rotaria sp. Silwood2]